MRQTMRETSYFVLAALLEGPTHGYALMQLVNEMSGGTVNVPVATLYGTLDRLAADGLIDQVGEEIVDGRARRIFALTPPGRSGLREEADRMAEAASVVHARLQTTKRPASKKRAMKPATP